MTLVSLVNYIGSDIEFILNGRSILYIRWTIQVLELILVSLVTRLWAVQPLFDSQHWLLFFLPLLHPVWLKDPHSLLFC